MAATLTSSLPLSVISAFLSPVQRWSRHGLITIGCSLGMTLLGSEVVLSSTDRLACGRAMPNGGQSPAQPADAHPNWIHRAGQTDALAALCLSFSPNPNAGIPAWLRRAADLGLPDAQLLLGADLRWDSRVLPIVTKPCAGTEKAAQADFPLPNTSSDPFIRRQGEPTARFA